MTDKQVEQLPKVCKRCPAANVCYIQDESKKPFCMNFSHEARKAVSLCK